MTRSAYIYRLMMRFYRPYQWIERFCLPGTPSTDETSSSHVVPVNQSLSPGGSLALPMKIVGAFVKRADGIAILNECLCRRGQGCRDYPVDLGCLLLGPAARDLHAGLGRLVGPDEALRYAEAAVRRGLTPLVVHNRFDAWLWGIDYGRMMNICFCCDCCCSVRRAVRLGIDSGAPLTMHRLEGLSVSIDGSCDGCGTCAAACFADAIRVRHNHAEINPVRCKGCGRCALVCPRSAVTMSLDDDAGATESLLSIYGERTDVGILNPLHTKKTENTA